MSMTVLCPFGLDGGLISKAATLEKDVRVLVPEKDAEAAALYGAKYIHTLPDGFTAPDEGAFARWLQKKLTQWQSTVVLAPATVQMRNIMPLLAGYMQAGLTADCTGLSMENGRLLQTRPAFGNSLMADIVTLTDVQLATVRPGTFRAQKTNVGTKAPLCKGGSAEGGGGLSIPPAAFQAATSLSQGRLAQPEITEEAPDFQNRVRDLGFTEFPTGTPLSQAKVIVAGGLGIGSKEGFAKLSKLAQKLGGAVGASRAAVDAGFAPYHCQVGITGVTVCPDIYIAVGISGAVQHLSGMSGAQKVIAINNDPKAPIFDYADYGIVGDWEEILEELL